jgi:hypothetical protein
MRALLIATITLATAACGGGQNQAVPAAESGNGTAAAGVQVAALSEGQRNAVFIRAIRDARLDCQHVESATPLGNVQNMPAWHARCEGGGDYTIVIGADGSAQVLAGQAVADGNQSAGNAAAGIGGNSQ